MFWGYRKHEIKYISRFRWVNRWILQSNLFFLGGGIVLTDIYNKSYNEALMSYSQRWSIFSLLPVFNRDNYRPIALLNVDLKLSSHVSCFPLTRKTTKLIKDILPNSSCIFKHFWDIVHYTRLYICI
jgi:hypothetical protein